MMDRKLDFKIYNSKNGITSWIDAKLPTVKTRILIYNFLNSLMALEISSS